MIRHLAVVLLATGTLPFVPMAEDLVKAQLARSNTNGATFTGTINSSVSSGTTAYGCTTLGCRLNLGNTARYFYDDGTYLRTPSPVYLESSISSFAGLLHMEASSGWRILSKATNSNTTASIALRVGTQNAITHEGAKLASFYSDNFSTERAFFSADGALRLNAAGAADPTCSSTIRGRIWFTPGGAGVADVIKVCMKQADDVTYSWTAL